MEVKQNMKNEMFKRQELTMELEADKTPSFAEAKQKVAEQVKEPCENVDVLGVHGKFGKNVFIINANIYDSKNELEKAVEMRKTQKQRIAEKNAVEEVKKKAAEEKKTAEEAKAAESA